jgi:hypothetical protein
MTGNPAPQNRSRSVPKQNSLSNPAVQKAAPVFGTLCLHRPILNDNRPIASIISPHALKRRNAGVMVQGRSSDSPRPLRRPSHPYCRDSGHGVSKQLPDTIRRGITAAGPFPIFTGFPITPKTGHLVYALISNRNHRCQILFFPGPIANQFFLGRGGHPPTAAPKNPADGKSRDRKALGRSMA